MDSDPDIEISAQLLEFAEQTTDFVGVSDPWGLILYLNPAARKRLGVADVAGLTLADVFPTEAFAFYYDVVRPQLLRTGAWTGEVLVRIAGGGAVPMYVSTNARLGPGGETNGGVMYAHELPRFDPVAVAGRADLDEVTGLLKRTAFDERVRIALADTPREDQSCALVIVTVAVSESIDAVTAASVMRALAGRMTRLARTIDEVGQVGEQQLGLLLRGVRGRNEALRIARTVYESLVDAPITTPGEEITPSIGCGVGFARPGDELADLIEQASTLMWHEAATREDEAEMPEVIAEGTDGSVTMDEFLVGLSRGDVRPYAQPVVDLASGLVVGYRGLTRWHHRRLGVLEPTAFVPLIAETPLANQVDLFIARETAAVLTLTTRDKPLWLYTPVSRRLVADIRTEQYLWEIADAFCLTMSQIHLQLARPLLEDWTPALRDALQSLRDAGITLVLTGVEHASDARLPAEHGFHELHLSRGLTSTVTIDDESGRAVSEIVRLAHDSDLVVAAAGIDDTRQRDVLIAAGCDLAYGDLYGEPEPANTID